MNYLLSNEFFYDLPMILVFGIAVIVFLVVLGAHLRLYGLAKRRLHNVILTTEAQKEYEKEINEIKEKTYATEKQRKKEMIHLRKKRDVKVAEYNKKINDYIIIDMGMGRKYLKTAIILFVLLFVVGGIGVYSKSVYKEKTAVKQSVNYEMSGLEIDSYSIMRNSDDSKILVIYLKNITEKTVKSSTVIIQNCDIRENVYGIGPLSMKTLSIDITDVSVEKFEFKLENVVLE